MSQWPANVNNLPVPCNCIECFTQYHKYLCKYKFGTLVDEFVK